MYGESAMRSSGPLPVPALGVRAVEDDDHAAVGKRQLEVVAAELARDPPTVFDHPLLADRVDVGAADFQRPASGVRPDAPPLRGVETANPGSHGLGKGVNIPQRSGTREVESTGRIFSSASGPSAAWTRRTASPRRRRRGSSPPTASSS